MDLKSTRNVQKLEMIIKKVDLRFVNVDIKMQIKRTYNNCGKDGSKADEKQAQTRDGD